MPSGPRVSTRQIQFPKGGLNRGRSFVEQFPFSSASLLNVRPRSGWEQRVAGGIRPGISKYADRKVASADTPIRMLNSVSFDDESTVKRVIESFDGVSMSSNWSALPGLQGPSDVTSGATQPLEASVVSDVLYGALSNIYKQVTDLDGTNEYWVEGWCPDISTGDITLLCWLNNTTPAGNNMCRFSFSALDANTIQVIGRLIQAGVQTVTFTTNVDVNNVFHPMWLSVRSYMDAGSYKAAVYVEGNLVNTITIPTAGVPGVPSGHRFGFYTSYAAYAVVTGQSIPQLSEFRVQYNTATETVRKRTMLLASSDGELWREKEYLNQLEDTGTTSSTITLNADERMESGQWLNKLYIADHGSRYRGQVSPNPTNVSTTVNAVKIVSDVVTLYVTSTADMAVGQRLNVALNGITFTDSATTIATVNGSPIITGLTSTAKLYPGMQLENGSVVGAVIPADAVVLSVDSATQITMSANATATTNIGLLNNIPIVFRSQIEQIMNGQYTILSIPTPNTLTFSKPFYNMGGDLISTTSTLSGTTTLSAISTGTAVLYPGMLVTGAGIAANTYVVSITNPTDVVVSQATANTGATAPIVYQPIGVNVTGTATVENVKVDPVSGGPADWTALGIEIDGDALVWTMTNTVTGQVFYSGIAQFASLAVGYAILKEPFQNVPNLVDVSYSSVIEVVRMPKVYDPVANTLVMLWAKSRFANATSVDVDKLVVADNIITVTTRAAHGMIAGDSVLLSLEPEGGVVTGVFRNRLTAARFNGIQTLASVPSATTFTFTKPATNATYQRMQVIRRLHSGTSATITTIANHEYDATVNAQSINIEMDPANANYDDENVPFTSGSATTLTYTTTASLTETVNNCFGYVTNGSGTGLPNTLETLGSVPDNCAAFCVWRGRLVFAKGNNWFMSRQGDPLDWDYGADIDDQQRAWADQLGGNVIAGEIIALIPWTDDYLIFACRNSMWLLRGDPAAGGQISNLSDHIGIISRGAWCRSDFGLLFISTDGITSWSNSGFKKMGEAEVPNEFKQLSSDMFEYAMAWDQNGYGLQIWCSPKAEQDFTYNTANLPIRHWWIDADYWRFWPMACENSLDAFMVHFYQSEDTRQSCVVQGGREGLLTRFVNGSYADVDDAGTDTFKSYCMFGPFLMSRDISRAWTARFLQFNFANILTVVSGKGIICTFRTGDTAEQATYEGRKNTKRLIGSGTEYYKSRPNPMMVNLTGTFCTIMLEGQGCAWTMESSWIKGQDAGDSMKGRGQ